jgi:hypothetical protein
MTLPASGPISLSQVNTELNWSSSRAITLGDSDVRKLASILSGPVTTSSLRGKGWYPQALGTNSGPGYYYLKTGGSVDSYWEWSSNFQTITIKLNGTTLYQQSSYPSDTTSITVGGRTYYRGAFQSGGGLFPLAYAFAWVE